MKRIGSNRGLWMAGGALACGAILVWCCNGVRKPPGAATAAGTLPVTDLTALSIRTGFALAAIVALILAAAWAARRFGVRPNGRRGGSMTVLERLDLGPRRAVYGLRAGERVVLLGVTDSSITPLLELSGEEADRMWPGGGTAPPVAFAGLLHGVLSKTRSS